MIRERALHWKYQGVWDVLFPAWGKQKAVVAYYPDKERYHIAVIGINFAPEWMTALEMGKWLMIHEAKRVHR